MSEAAILRPEIVRGHEEASANHFLWIDILRGIAAVAIVVYHARVDLWVGFKAIAAHPEWYSKLDLWTSYLSAPVPFFRSGVMLFFLVSGFCIHYPYARGRVLELQSYAVRRWFRIYPPYLIAVLLTILVEQIRFYAAAIASSSHLKIWQTIFMVQNYAHDPAQMVGNSALWSLPVEVELYLLYPVFWLMIRRFGAGVAFRVVSLVSSTALVGILAYSPLRERFAAEGRVGNALMYWVVWCAGALLAEQVRNSEGVRIRRGWVLVVLALVAMVSTAKGWAIEFQELLWAGFWFVVLGIGLRNGAWLAGLPSGVRRSLSYLGAISYSLYLVHYPFFKLCAVYWLRRDGHPQGNFLVMLVFCVAVIPVAHVFHLLFERPFHLLARQLATVSVASPGDAEMSGSLGAEVLS